jgi:hypothetical protein
MSSLFQIAEVHYISARMSELNPWLHPWLITYCVLKLGMGGIDRSWPCVTHAFCHHPVVARCLIRLVRSDIQRADLTSNTCNIHEELPLPSYAEL